MAVEVKIPAVGESISSGVVSVWHKKSGDFVNAGDALFTLETDKVSTEIAAEKSGVLEALVPEGQEVKIGEVVATIDDSKKPPQAAPGQPVAAADGQGSYRSAQSGPQPTPAAGTLSPAVRRIVEEEHLDPAKISGSGMSGRLTKADVLAAAQNRAPVAAVVDGGRAGRSAPATTSSSVGEAVGFPATSTPSPTDQPRQ